MVRLHGLFRKFSCVQRTYHFTDYQVWGFLVSSGNFRACDVRTISPTTKCGASWFLQEIFMHTMYIPCSTDNTGACPNNLVFTAAVIPGVACIKECMGRWEGGAWVSGEGEQPGMGRTFHWDTCTGSTATVVLYVSSMSGKNRHSSQDRLRWPVV